MLESVKLVVTMAIALSFCAPFSSGLADEIYEIQTEDSERTYPNDWTHRPFVELFSSLSCVYCMTYADPAMDQVIHDVEGDESNPYNVIVFHQTNGGDGDDPFHTEQSKSRMTDMLVAEGNQTIKIIFKHWMIRDQEKEKVMMNLSKLWI
jgi:hypothetical protein